MFQQIKYLLSEIVSDLIATSRSKKDYEELGLVAQRMGNYFQKCVKVPRDTERREEVVKKKWANAFNHYTGNHDECSHPEGYKAAVELKPQKPSALKLKEIIDSKMKMIARVDPEFATSRLEGHNSVIGRFCPKQYHYFKENYVARTYVAAIHTTENCAKELQRNPEGNIRKVEVVKKLSYRKDTKEKPRSELSTYAYCRELVRACLENEENGANQAWRAQHPVPKDQTIIDSVRQSKE